VMTDAEYGVANRSPVPVVLKNGTPGLKMMWSV